MQFRPHKRLKVRISQLQILQVTFLLLGVAKNIYLIFIVYIVLAKALNDVVYTGNVNAHGVCTRLFAAAATSEFPW